MNLAEKIRIQDMKVIAFAEFGVEAPKVNNLAHVHDKSPELFKFEILALWRDKTPENTNWVRYALEILQIHFML